MKLIGHRGASHEAPENTIAAIHLAWQERADGVEVDVRLTLDRKIVVIHDENTQRIAGKQLMVADQTWDVLRSLDAGTWKSPRWNHVSIPLLRDVFKVVPSSRELFVEIKCGKEILEPLAADMEVIHPSTEALRFVGFSPEIMRSVKGAFPDYRTFLNVEPRGSRGAPANWTTEGLVDRAKQAAADGLSVGWCEPVDEAFVQGVAASGLDLAVWTVDDEHTALRLQRAGLPRLMTNKPGFLHHRLKEHPAR